MVNRLVKAGLFLGAVAGACLASFRTKQKRHLTHKVKPEPLQRWEGEGGALPVHGSQAGQPISPPVRPAS